MKKVEEVKDEKKDSGLTAGDFDEDESHNSFLKALNAWRGDKPDYE